MRKETIRVDLIFHRLSSLKTQFKKLLVKQLNKFIQLNLILMISLAFFFKNFVTFDDTKALALGDEKAIQFDTISLRI